MHVLAFMQSRRSRARVAGAVLALAVLTPSFLPAATLRINGSTTVQPPVAEAAEALRGELGIEIHMDTFGGSAGGIAAVADGRAEIGLSSRPLTPEDRQKFPDVDFHLTRIGVDAVALIVSRDVWEAGVRGLSREEMQSIYEKRVTRWDQIGGPARRIAFFNKEPGRGTWEVFAHWLYGDGSKAPAANFPEVGGNEETRNKVGSTRGALSQLSATWADGKRVFAVGIRMEDGSVVEPTAENVASGRYPMSRPLYLITRGEPTGAARSLIDYMLGPRGQSLVRKHGYLALEDLAVEPAGRDSAGQQ